MSGTLNFWKIDNSPANRYIEMSTIGFVLYLQGEIMRSVILSIALVLSLSGCSQNADPEADARERERDIIAVEEVRALFITRSIQKEGREVLRTIIMVKGLSLPGITENMTDPFLSGVFEDQSLVVAEMLACDAKAFNVEESCVAIPDSFRADIAGELIILFDRYQAKQNQQALEPQPENFPKMQSPLGITNTT